MQFTIHCPPNLMARIYNIGTWCTQLLTDLHKKWTQLLVSLPLLALILLHTLSPYKSNNLSLSLSNAHVSDTRALVIVKNWSKPEIVGQTDDVGQSGHWPLRECPLFTILLFDKTTATTTAATSSTTTTTAAATTTTTNRSQVATPKQRQRWQQHQQQTVHKRQHQNQIQQKHPPNISITDANMTNISITSNVNINKKNRSGSWNHTM